MNISKFAGNIIGATTSAGEATAKALTGFAKGAIQATEKANASGMSTAAKAVATGFEGALAGTAGGAVIGGIVGAVDKDESVLSGMGKGALIGGAGGLAIGTASGALHKNMGLYSNAVTDYHKIAENISKAGAEVGNGIDNAIANNNRVNAAFMNRSTYQNEMINELADYASGLI